MSSLGNKGEKNQGKFKSIDINNLYKGTSVIPQKPTPASNRQHGLQSLGKVANLRRMPPPANLPSLKSEHSGVEQITPPNSSSSGWTKEENTVEAASPPNAALQKSSPFSPSSLPSQEHAMTQIADGSHTRSAQPSMAGPVLWSNVTSGGRKPGSFLDQKSVLFQEEFPQLALGSEDRTVIPRKEEESKEVSYGPGLNLRPQNEGSWRDGGGGRTPSSSSDDQLSHPASQMPADGSETAGEDTKPPNVMAPLPFRGPVPVMPVRPGMPPPPHLGQMPFCPPPNFRMMMQFGFRPGFPPNFIPPGMPRPPFMNPADMRFQGMFPPGMQGWHYPGGPGTGPVANSGSSAGLTDELASERPAIVKDKDLEEFDRLAISDDGWARSNVDIDYSERLVFSDEEDTTAQDKSGKMTGDRQAGDQRKDRQKDSSQRSLKEQSSADVQRPNSDSGGSPSTPKEAWMGSNMPGQHIWHPMHSDRRQWMPEVQYDTRSSSVPFSQPQFLLQRPSLRPPVPADMPGSVAGGGEQDDEDMWRQRRKQQSESMSAAIERARQRREEEERRMKEEQTAAAREKLRQLDEKCGKKDDKDDAFDRSKNVASTDSKDDGKRRNPSGSGSAGGNTRMNPVASKSDYGPLPTADVMDSGVRGTLSASPSGSSSPRAFQSIPTRLPAPPRVTASGSYWPYDPRSWNNMPLPPRYMMDPRGLFMMQARSPVPGMPVRIPMRQSSANDSGSDTHELLHDSGDQSSLRALWHDQNIYVGSSDQQNEHPISRGTHGLYNTLTHDDRSEDNSSESSQHMLPYRGPPLDAYPERTELSSGNTVPLAWGDQCVETDDDDDERVNSLHSLGLSAQSVKRSVELASKECSTTYSISRHAAQQSGRQVFDRTVGSTEDKDKSVKVQEYDSHNARKRDNSSSQKTASDDTYHRQSSGGNNSAIKRTHSSASNSSAASTERKTDSPRDIKGLDRFTRKESADRQPQHQKILNQELQKTNNGAKSQDQTSIETLSVKELKLALPDDTVSAEQKSVKSAELSAKADNIVADTQTNAGNDRPPAKRIKNGSRPYRRRKEGDDVEQRARVSIGSREFVRGGRTRIRGANRGRGRGYRDEYDGYNDYRAGYRGSQEEEDEYEFQHARKSADFRPDVDRKRASQPSGGHNQGQIGDLGNSRNDTSAGPRRDGYRNQRGNISQGRASQKAESAASCQRNEASKSHGNDLQQAAGSLNTDQSVSFVKSSQQLPAGPSTDGSGGDARPGPRSRNSGGRSRRNNRPVDQQRHPQQQAVDKVSSADQPVNKTPVEQQVEPGQNKSLSTESANEPLEVGPVQKVARRRRRNPGWGRKNLGNSSNADPANHDKDAVDSIGVREPPKVDTRPSQHTTSEQGQKPQKDSNRQAEKVNQSEGGAVRDTNSSRQRHRPGRKPANSQQASSGRPQLPDQAVGAANEEWETASESSDVLKGSEHHHSHRQQQPKKDRDRQNSDRRDTRKSFTNQRPSSNRRGGFQGGQRGGEMTNDANRGFVRAETRQMNGSESAVLPPTPRPDVLSMPAVGQNGNVHTVYRLDHVVYDRPDIIQQTFSRFTARFSHLTDQTSVLNSILSGDVRQTELSSVVDDAKKGYDSGIDFSDVSSPSCCSSPFDDNSSQHSFEIGTSSVFDFDVMNMEAVGQKGVELLANTINLTSVRNIWQAFSSEPSADSHCIWSSVGSCQVEQDSTDDNRCSEPSFGVTAAVVMQHINGLQDVCQVGRDIETKNCCPMPTITSSKCESVLNEDTFNDELHSDFDNDSDIDITTMNYKTDEDSQ